MKLLTRDISISRLFPSGSVECSAVVNDTYYHRRYMDYTLTEALRMFREYVKAEEQKYIRVRNSYHD